MIDEEFTNLRSQFVASNHGGSRYMPFAFTEQGVAMLSSILNTNSFLVSLSNKKHCLYLPFLKSLYLQLVFQISLNLIYLQ